MKYRWAKCSRTGLLRKSSCVMGLRSEHIHPWRFSFALLLFARYLAVALAAPGVRRCILGFFARVLCALRCAPGGLHDRPSFEFC